MLIKARIAADNEDMAGISSVIVFGRELTEEFAEFEVSNEILGKLKSNPTVEVLVRKPETAKPPEAAKPAPQPVAPKAPEPETPSMTPVLPVETKG